MTQQDFVRHISKEIQQFGSLRKAALAWGMSAAYLSAVVNYKRTPGPMVLDALGWEMVEDYRQKQGVQP